MAVFLIVISENNPLAKGAKTCQKSFDFSRPPTEKKFRKIGSLNRIAGKTLSR